MKTVYESGCYLGKLEYRVTADASVANLQCRESSWYSWETIWRMGRAEFDEMAERHDIYNPYNQNPAHVPNLLREACNWAQDLDEGESV